MRSKRLAALSLAASLLVPGVAFAQQNGAAPRTTPAAARNEAGTPLPPINYTTFKLPNGLNVILHQDRSTPIVAVNLWYHVGSKNEVPGRTGFAHLFEHMMFQGSKNYNDDYFTPLQEAGGTLNGSTNPDRTNYWEVVPSNFLELALFLEADRMGGLLEAMTMEKLNNQRDVVKNEKRQNYDNQPYGLARAKIAATMYPPSHPYHWLTIGSLDDLTAASMDDVKDFFRRFYTPNNASLAIAGDFDPAEARRLVEKHFGPIARGPAVPKVNAPQPKLDKEIRATMEDRVTLPRTYMVWHSEPQFSANDAALDMLGIILVSGGKSSRLYKSLVYDKQIAQDVVGFNQSGEIAGAFQLWATAKPGRTPAEIEAAINDEIAKIKAAPPSREEMERAYNSFEARTIYGLQTVGGFGGKSDQLNQYATFVGDPGYFEQDLARYRRITAEDVRRVANTYLTDKRMILTVTPRAKSGATAAGEAESTARPATRPAPQTAGATESGQASSTGQTGAAPGAAQTPNTGPSQTGTDRPAGAAAPTKTEKATSPAAGAAPPTTAAPRADQATAKNTAKRDAGANLPQPKPDPRFTLPRIERRRLANGLEVVMVQHQELPVVNMNLVLKTGAAADAPGRGGLASFTADMLDEGTKTRSALEISDALAAVGASLGTGAGWDSAGAQLTALARHLDRALDIYAEVITNPAFPDKEFERLRATRLASLKQRRDNANAIAGVVYPSLIFGRNHPYGHSLTGDEASVGAINAAEVRKFYQTYYRPNNATLIVVGDVRPDTLMPKLERAFGSWARGEVPAVDVAAAAAVPRERATVYLVDRPGAAQSVITIGQVGVPRSTPDYFPLLVLNTMLGGQFTSRINLNLRENKGYTYGARSEFDYRRGAGPFAASAGVQTAVTKESVVEFMKELRGIRGENPVTPAELEFSKQAIIRGFPRSFETPAQIAARLETIVLYGLPDEYFNDYIERVRAVSLGDITRVANRYLDPTKMAILVVGDRRVIEPALRSLDGIGGTLVVVDAEGNPVAAGGESGSNGMR